MNGRRISLIIALVLVNYLILSTVWTVWSRDSSAIPTPTRTPKPTFTPAPERMVYLTPTSTATSAALAMFSTTSSPSISSPTPSPTPSATSTVAHRDTETPSPTGTQAISPTPLPSSTPVPTVTPVIHVVAPGDMLLALAVKYGMTVEALMEANGLTNSDLIYIGQRLVIPVGSPIPEREAGDANLSPTPAPIATSFIHIVQVGEHLAGIASRYGVTVPAIAEANGLRSTEWIFVGQRLIIPTTSPASTPAPGSTPRIHVVRAGENLTWIAGRYGVSLDALMRANSITNPDTIYVGQILTIP